MRMVANTVRSPRDEATVREFAARHQLPLSAVVPYDEAVVAADERGVALIEYQPGAPSVAVIRRLADELLAPNGA